MGNNLGELFIQGGWVMWPLLFFSILTWAVVLERAYVYFTIRPKLKRLGSSLAQSITKGELAEAKQRCGKEPAWVGEAFLAAIDTGRTRESAERAMVRQQQKMMAQLKKNLWILGTLGSASPFVGLLGTVVGIVKAFGDMAEKGAGGFSVVAGGISEALIATAAGLIVAIIALLTYNIFVTLANQTISHLKLSLEELLEASFEKVS